ncbi:MAG: TetR/AcrR family transcriptional regulator [Pseudomonas sp.]|nr:TetR/AcrR family transcriptional regulator [Pseudomonadales bacterium]MDZ7889082.1 TetR/AcrR family transcriptional regulator [Pseudomonas sp.]
MSSNPLDRRSLRSRSAILGAMLALLGEQPFARLTVAQICLRADVARPTFYLHFSGKEEALLSFMDEVFEQFFAEIEPQLPQAELNTTAICLQLFEQWHRHRQLLRALLDAGLESTMQQRFRHYGARLVGRYLSQRQLRVQEPALMPYLIDSIAATALAFLMRWLREDLTQSVVELAACYESICRHGMLAMLDPNNPG